jgi:hypothetical protein
VAREKNGDLARILSREPQRLVFILAPMCPLDIIDTLLKGKQHVIDQSVAIRPWRLGKSVQLSPESTASELSEWDERHGR